MHITQSALSQRIRQLEREIGSVLLNRSSQGVELTEAGRKVLRFCRASSSLEEEILSDLALDPTGPLKRVVRIAAHSSILQPVLIPALAPLLRQTRWYSVSWSTPRPNIFPEFLNMAKQNL